MTSEAYVMTTEDDIGPLERAAIAAGKHRAPARPIADLPTKLRTALERLLCRPKETMATVIPIRPGDDDGEGFDDASPLPEDPKPWRSDLILNDSGNPKSAMANVVLMLTKAPEWSGVLAYDTFAEQIRMMRSPPWRDERLEPGSWSDADTGRLVVHVERTIGISPSTGMAYAAADNVARRSLVHPVRDWMSGIDWDGVKRIDGWLSTYMGAPATAYVVRVGRQFMISAVARVYSPGCKVDTMPVFESPQGFGKSTGLRTLFSDPWFSDTPLDLASKNRFVALRAVWGVEVAELDSFNRAEADRIKSYLSSPSDKYRPPYGRADVNIKRQCVFAGTVNRDDYLRDETGNRRFWPVKVGRIDIHALERDRAQLWAEALEMYRSGVPWWPDADEAKVDAAEQAERVQRDAWTDIIDNYLRAEHRDAITVGELLRDAIGMKQEKWSTPEQTRVARALRILGWEKRRAPRVDGQPRTWAYVPVHVVSEGE